MASKLELYNAALSEIGVRKLASLSENTEARRELDNHYDAVLEDCLAAGSWNFAMETVMLEADTGIEPAFGFPEVFAKPTDWVRTFAISDDPDFTAPLTAYYDDMNFWSANMSPIYARYVSNDTGMGLELNRWTRTFTRFVELELAERICMRLTQNREMKKDIGQDRDKARLRALSNDAMNDVQPKFAPTGALTLARGGAGRGDRGSRSRLTG